MLPPCYLYLTQYEAESPAWILSPLSRYMDSFFSSPVDVMLPPCYLYLTQYEAESPAWILSPLSRYMDSFFYVVKTLPSLLLYVLYFYSCVIPSHPPFPKDLTADGDIESNPGPLSKDSLEYLNPGQWIDDYALSEYSKHLFKEANLDWECYFITPDEMWSDFLTDGYCQNKIDDARERSTRYFAVPLNDAMNTTGGSGGVHWGLMVIDCAENNAIFVDPIVGSSYLSSVVDELCRKVTLNVQRVNITKTQTPNDCGIYVIGYIQKFVELISRDGINLSLISIERALIQVNNELNAADLRKQIQKLFTYVDDQLFIKYSKILVESTGLIFYDYVIGPTDLYPLLYGDQPYSKYPFSNFLTQKFFQCGQNNQQMLLVPVNSAMCDLTADGRHWGLIILIISSPTSHILFIDPTYVEDDYAREFPANQTPVALSSSNLFTIVSKIYSVLSMCETRNIEFISSNIKHTLTDSGFCVLEYIDLLMNLDQSVVIRWTDVKELLGNTTIAVHESRSKILEHFETFSPVDLSHVPKMPAVPPKRLSSSSVSTGATPQTKVSAINLLPPTVSKPVPASLTGLRLASTKASTGLSTKKSKPKLASPRGSPRIKHKESRTTNSLVSTGITPQTNISVTTVSEPVPTSPTPKPSITEQEPKQPQKFCVIEIESVISDPERLNLKVVRVKQEPEVDEEIESTSEGIPQIQDTTFEIQRDPDLDPIVSISLQFTHDKFANETHLFTHNVSEISLPNCVVHTFTTEKSMLTNFITFLNLNKPSLLISYDWHLDTFPFFVSRCKKLEIDIDYTIDDYISSLPSWFHRWCKPTEIGPFIPLT
ncbi:hypothetical protein GEMRC1_000575 [Eukaryota sp. GEM-RC1]